MRTIVYLQREGVAENLNLHRQSKGRSRPSIIALDIRDTLVEGKVVTRSGENPVMERDIREEDGSGCGCICM
jgi:hypothetical protein